MSGMKDRIDVLLVKKWDTEDIRSLYREAGWWKEEWDPVHLRPPDVRFTGICRGD